MSISSTEEYTHVDGSVSKLSVSNEDFLVVSMIERCPKTMMLRELVKNALEAAAKTTAGDKRVEITALKVAGVRKLRIWNTGPGLNTEDLFRMCDLASSIGKVQDLDRNFGMGAKVASLPSNHLGVRYRSCADGRVNEAIIGKRNGVYGRLLRPGPDGGSQLAVIDVTAEVEAQGGNTERDWTEVTLLGNRDDQDTVADPYDRNPRVGRGWVLTALQQRFFCLDDGLQIMLGPDIHDGPGMRPFIPLAGHMTSRFARTDGVALPDGVVVRFGYDPAHPETPDHNASHHDHLSPSQSFAALLYHDELYEVRTGARWTQDAPIFGISFGARHLSVVVELPAHYPVRPEGYRQFMRYREGTQDQVRLVDFAAIVRAARPHWVRELVRQHSSDLDMIGDIDDQLEKLIATLGLKRMRPLIRHPRIAPAVATGAPVPSPQQPPTSVNQNKSMPSQTKPAPVPTPPEAGPDADGVPIGLVEDLEVLPELLLLRNEQEIADRNLTYRAARFYPDTHQLYVNLRYPTVAALAELLAPTAPPLVAPETAREVATAVAESLLVLRLGRALIHSLSKRGAAKGWTDGEKQQVLSSELLTIAADDLNLALPTARELFDQRIAKVAAVQEWVSAWKKGSDSLSVQAG